MPQDIVLANETWNRYCYVRDRGHNDYVRKAVTCEDFFAGLQWDASDLALLRAQKRPALTINKIISTLSNVMGEQIFNRVEIGFQPRSDGATQEVANALTKVFMQISESNQLSWTRSDVFADGIIGSRGFFDVRLGFDDNLRGQVEIAQLNPKNVLIDPDAEEYDPDKWGDVIISKWLSPNDISMLYGEEDAKLLSTRQDSYYPYGYDSVERDRDRFGTFYPSSYGWNPESGAAIQRNVRVIERQYRKITMQKQFVDVATGEARPVPDAWGRDRIAQHLAMNQGLSVIKRQVPRIRWTVVADALVLHDDWSPFNHYTVVPYFPYFRRGRTIGLVENLLGPQELLNKVSSQELHVVNTTANSGWKIKRGALQNMTVEELEQRGAQSGLVLELDDVATGAEKITPNQVPTGLDRISMKSEEHIKSISGVSDYDAGFAREDVSAKSVLANQKAGSKGRAKVLDNLARTDHILARNILDVVQTYYSEERLVYITKDRFTGEQESITVNQNTPEGRIVNDLMLGEYCVVATAEPERDTYEDSQFEQAINLRENGVQIPDAVLIESSRLRRKHEITKSLEEKDKTPEAQAAKQLQMRKASAEVSDMESSAAKNRADAAWKVTKAHRDMADLKNGGEPEGALDVEIMKIEREMQLEKYKFDKQLELDRWKAEQELTIKRDAERSKVMLARAQAAHAAPNPTERILQ